MERLQLLTSTSPLPSTDGRLARGERTRVKVADALISLLEEDDAAPTAKMVAQRAGVSLRLVFHHYDDMDDLYRAVMALQAQRYWSRLRAIPSDLPSTQRVDRTVRQRSRLFEAIGPVRRAVVSLASRSDELADELAESSAFLRSQLEVTFAPELEAASDGATDLLDAVDAAASWEAWDRLRHGQHLSAVAARRVMVRTLRALFGLTGDWTDGAKHGARHPRRRAARHGSQASARPTTYR
jgi:AcrR family transcriptional regulator